MDTETAPRTSMLFNALLHAMMALLLHSGQLVTSPVRQVVLDPGFPPLVLLPSLTVQ